VAKYTKQQRQKNKTQIGLFDGCNNLGAIFFRSIGKGEVNKV
jgi:hypothetical protein